MTLGEKILSLRKAKNLSIQELSVLSGLSEVTICHYENNRIKPRLNNIQKIASALNCDFEELYKYY